MAGPLVADTGGLLRALARRPDGRPAWPTFARTLGAATRVIVPEPVLTEVDYFLRENRPAMHELVRELLDPSTTLEYHVATPEDLARAIEIDRKFHQLKIGLADGVVAAVAERLKVHRILTIDHEDFGPLRIGERYTQKLDIVP